jgi:hypothetical protein
MVRFSARLGVTVEQCGHWPQLQMKVRDHIPPPEAKDNGAHDVVEGRGWVQMDVDTHRACCHHGAESMRIRGIGVSDILDGVKRRRLK